MPTFAQQFYRTAFSYRRSLIAICTAGVAYWVLLPSPGQIGLERCEPDGWIARTSARVHGPKFWTTQLSYVRAKAAKAEGWDAFRSRLREHEDRIVARAESNLAAIYEKHPSLAPTRADRLREMADKIDEAADERRVSEIFMQEAAAARRCEAKIINNEK